MALVFKQSFKKVAKAGFVCLFFLYIFGELIDANKRKGWKYVELLLEK